MTFLLSALAFFVLLSVLILIHEWGHYAAARKAGVVVEEFGFGLPPRAKTLFTYDKTHFTLNWIPFGGFVRLKGENAVDVKEHTAPGSFGAASVPARIMILCGGVFMNFILALVILTLGFAYGQWIPVSVQSSVERMEQAAEDGLINLELNVFIREVVSGASAAQVGVPADSFLTHVDGTPVTYPEEVMALQSGKRKVTYTLVSAQEGAAEEQFTVSLADGKAGVVLISYPKTLEGINHSLPVAFLLALRESKDMMVQTVYGMGHLFLSLASKGAVPEGITGIVGIAQYTHSSVQEGLGSYLRLTALLNLSLAALNILPFPALDGGRLLFVLAEAVQRKPVNRKFELATNGFGFVFLILLILLITYNDIISLFS